MSLKSRLNLLINRSSTNSANSKTHMSADELLSKEYAKNGKFQGIVSIALDELSKKESAMVSAGVITEDAMNNKERQNELLRGAQYYAAKELKLKDSKGLLALKAEMKASPYWEGSAKAFTPNKNSDWHVRDFESTVKQATNTYQRELISSKAVCRTALDKIKLSGLSIITSTLEGLVRPLGDGSNCPQMSLNCDEYAAFNRGGAYFVFKALGLDKDPQKSVGFVKMTKDMVSSGYWKDPKIDGLTPTSRWGLSKDQFKDAAESAIRTCGTNGSSLLKAAKISNEQVALISEQLAGGKTTEAEGSCEIIKIK